MGGSETRAREARPRGEGPGSRESALATRVSSRQTPRHARQTRGSGKPDQILISVTRPLEDESTTPSSSGRRTRTPPHTARCALSHAVPTCTHPRPSRSTLQSLRPSRLPIGPRLTGGGIMDTEHVQVSARFPAWRVRLGNVDRATPRRTRTSGFRAP